MATKKQQKQAVETVRLVDPISGTIVHVSPEYAERLQSTKRPYTSADDEYDREDEPVL